MTELSEQTMATVEATAPILRDRGLEITTHFYDRLLRTHPEVVPMFEDARAVQAERLATAVLAYASNIRNLDVLGAAVETIAKRHVGAGVRPEHYPIVGEHLLASMVEVLGELDSSILDAWSDAYNYLADILIAAEGALAAEATK